MALSLMFSLPFSSRSKGEQLSRAILTIAGKPEDNTAKVEIHAAVLRASFDIIGQAGAQFCFCKPYTSEPLEELGLDTHEATKLALKLH
eukprot:scaffold63912_cov18-Tisochrysis_lutea.AAC.2